MMTVEKTYQPEETLFDLGVQPWISDEKPSILSEEQEKERKAILASLANSELGRMELRVAWILHHYPDTRDIDAALALRYWKVFQADILSQWDRMDLDIILELDNFETISRFRRHIDRKSVV